MKKNGWILLLFVVLGLLAGALANRWLESVPGLDALARTLQIAWTPAADLAVLSFKLDLRLHISLLSIAGAVLAIWIYRKM